jgi:acetyltransferase-like isoleucine patch superfamily enzyme
MLKHNERYSGDFNVHFRPITIKNDVCIGGNVTILPGITIGNNVIVGGGSVVTKNIPDGSIVAGNPAVVVGKVDELANKRKDIEEHITMETTRKDVEKVIESLS